MISKSTSPTNKRRDVAIIILYDIEKKILLQHRSETALRNPGYWAFFGGGIEENETPIDTVMRETYEELRYKLNKPKLVLTQKPVNARVMYVFMEQYDGLQKLELHEGQDMRWISLPYPKELKISEHDQEVLEYIRGKY